MYDSAVERAIKKAQPLPLPPDVKLFGNFRELRLTFRPNSEKAEWQVKAEKEVVARQVKAKKDEWLALQKEKKEIMDKYQEFRHSANGQLLYSFVFYQRVQACYEALKGYLVVYVNEVEMLDAKNKIRAVQSKLKNNLLKNSAKGQIFLKNSTKEQVWDQAIKINEKFILHDEFPSLESLEGLVRGAILNNIWMAFYDKNIINEIKTNPSKAQEFCPTFKSQLTNQFVEVLGSELPKKDF